MQSHDTALPILPISSETKTDAKAIEAKVDSLLIDANATVSIRWHDSPPDIK